MTLGTTYARSAAVYDLIYEFKDYPRTTQRLRDLLSELAPKAESLLDVGCGTGVHLELLGRGFEREGLDLSGEMLAIAQRRCPDIRFHQADMAAFMLDRTFDVVTCLFSAVGYVATPKRLSSAIVCMASHLNPGGILLLEPWLEPHAYVEGNLVHNIAEREGHKVSWMYLAERHNLVSRFDIHYLVGHANGVEHYAERHEMGLFTGAQYTSALQNADLRISYDPAGLFGRGLYIGVKR